VALMGLDIGTTGCKASIFDENGNLSSYAYKEYSIINNGPGHFEIDPEKVWEATKYVIAGAVKSNKGDKVTAISTSSLGESTVPIDVNGRVLYNSQLYMDTRGEEQCERLKTVIGLDKIMEYTGLHAHPMYTICKVMWFREKMPEIYKKVWKFMLFGDYILYKLGNVSVLDYSLASRTMAFNIIKKEWENSIFEAAEIDCKAFSKPVASGVVVGSISRTIANEVGLPEKVSLVTGGHDQICAAIGGGIIKPGLAIDNIGTTECIIPAFNKPFLNKSMLKNKFSCVPHAIDGMFATYAFNFTAGSLLKWYRDNFAAAELAESLKIGENVYSILDKKAWREPTNILVLPHFAGSGTPYMDTSARGAIFDLGFDVTPGKFYRAMLEGVNYEILYNIECLNDAGIHINELRAAGGGANSDLWLQIKADILGREIVALNVAEAGCLGAAILAGVATGTYSSISHAVERLVNVRNVFYPSEKKHELYLENYYKYKKMYNVVKEVLSSSKAL
jgi:xylulokinase